MPRSLSDDQLAEKLEQWPCDPEVCQEAARRIREIDLVVMLAVAEAASAVAANPLLDLHHRDIAQLSVLGVLPLHQSGQRIASAARRILAGEKYDHRDVLTIATVASRDYGMK